MGILVADKVGANFLDHADQARAARTSIKPDGEWRSFRLIPGGNKNVMNFATADLSIKKSGVDSFVDHALELYEGVLVG